MPANYFSIFIIVNVKNFLLMMVSLLILIAFCFIWELKRQKRAYDDFSFGIRERAFQYIHINDSSPIRPVDTELFTNDSTLISLFSRSTFIVKDSLLYSCTKVENIDNFYDDSETRVIRGREFRVIQIAFRVHGYGKEQNAVVTYISSGDRRLFISYHKCESSYIFKYLKYFGPL